MNASHFDKTKYDRMWDELNRELKAIEGGEGGFVRALEVLREQQRAQGFIRDDLELVEKYKFHHPEDLTRYFSAQYNPTRVHRFKGAGRSTPPSGVNVVHNGCSLCRENIEWQQYGLEAGYDIRLNSTPYIVWMNPYPLMPVHAVIASKDHVPQVWSRDKSTAAQFGIEKILIDLVTLSGRSPGYIGFYNGVQAGASKAEHFHFQLFKRPEPGMLFPLEIAAQQLRNGTHVVIEDYPVIAACWRGDASTVAVQGAAWLRNCVAQSNGDIYSPSANIFAILDEVHQQTQLYIVPRDRRRSQSSEMSGMIGGLEILGELVFLDENEKQRLDVGEVDYDTVERILGSVRVDLSPSSTYIN